MPSYTPPLRDMQFLLHEVFDAVSRLKAIPRYADVDADTVNAVLEGAGTFAAEVTQPLNMSGDRQGCTHDPATKSVLGKSCAGKGHGKGQHEKKQ